MDARLVLFGQSMLIGLSIAAPVGQIGVLAIQRTLLHGRAAGLAIHIPLISIHALLILTILTVLVELDLARSAGREGAPSSLRRTIAVTARNTVIHPPRPSAIWPGA